MYLSEFQQAYMQKRVKNPTTLSELQQGSSISGISPKEGRKWEYMHITRILFIIYLPATAFLADLLVSLKSFCLNLQKGLDTRLDHL